jgi:hypothetical protein
VRKQINDVLAQNPATIEMFHRVASWKQTGLHEEEDNTTDSGDQPDPLNKIRTKVRKNMTDLVKNQKLSYLREGCTFKAYGQKQKGNKNAQQYVFLRLHDSMQHLGWANTSTPTEKPTGELPNIGTHAYPPSYSPKFIPVVLRTRILKITRVRTHSETGRLQGSGGGR